MKKINKSKSLTTKKYNTRQQWDRFWEELLTIKEKLNDYPTVQNQFLKEVKQINKYSVQKRRTIDLGKLKSSILRKYVKQALFETKQLPVKQKLPQRKQSVNNSSIEDDITKLAFDRSTNTKKQPLQQPKKQQNLKQEDIFKGDTSPILRRSKTQTNEEFDPDFLAKIQFNDNVPISEGVSLNEVDESQTNIVKTY